MSENVAPGAGRVDHAVNDQRRRFLASSSGVVVVPIQPERIDVIDIDLCKWAKAIFRIVKTVFGPLNVWRLARDDLFRCGLGLLRFTASGEQTNCNKGTEC